MMDGVYIIMKWILIKIKRNDNFKLLSEIKKSTHTPIKKKVNTIVTK